MSNSFDNCLTNAGDVTIEPVSKGDTVQPPEETQPDGKEVGTQEIMDGRQTSNEDCSEDSNEDRSENGRRKKAVAPMRTDEIEEIRSDGSADDMDLDETIDSHIGVRMESERQHTGSLPSDDNDEEEEEEDDDIGIDSVNILDTLPLEGTHALIFLMLFRSYSVKVFVLYNINCDFNRCTHRRPGSHRSRPPWQDRR